MGSDHFHRICTYKEAEEAIRKNEAIYVNDCFCRGPAKAGEAKWEYCGCPVEVCMGFHPPKEDWDFTSRKISKDEALAMYKEWKNLGNLFRFMEDEEWVCFCCSCGCGFFRDEEGKKVRDTGEKSPFIEKTDLDKCNLCGMCIDVCAYEARSIDDGKMIVVSDNCAGCSACEYACTEDAISMIARG